MKKFDYYVLDVFSNERYKGNQLSVVYTDEELSIEQYYAVSREFGYSETSFVHYSTEESVFKVRSFTSAEFEVIGAGHNLLGAVCLALLKKWDIFKNQDGLPFVMIKDIKVAIQVTEVDELPYVTMQQPPAKIISSVPARVIAEAIGLKVGDLSLKDWPLNIVQTEVPHLMVPVNNPASLKSAVANKSLLKEVSAKFGFEGFYLFTTNDLNSDYLAEARFFNPGIGIDEDPATGTAAGPLAGYLEQLGYAEINKDYRILQGQYLNHPSIINVKVVNEGIWVSGSAVIVMEGQLYL